ncbi:MAG: DMT family transporter, partial [Gammaproteobacteria bacterium]|nr:DMT family transporter [Gammaproteobacteria bacterium]
CALSWSTYTLLGKYIMHSPHPISALVLVTYSCVCGTIILAVWILLSEQEMSISPTMNLIGAIGYLSAIGTVAGFIWFFDAVQKLGATQSSVFVFLVPVSAIIFGYILLDEKITLSLFVGALLIISGVYLTNKNTRSH